MKDKRLQILRHMLKIKDLDHLERGDAGEAALRHLMQMAELVWMGIDQQKCRKADSLSDSKRPDFVIVSDGETTFLDAKFRKTDFPIHQDFRFAALPIAEKLQYTKFEELTGCRVFFVFFPNENHLKKYIVMELDDLSECCKVDDNDGNPIDALGLKLTAEVIEERFDMSSYRLTL